MSTRANVILKEGNDKLYFYRHSDGYPSGTLPTLNKFMQWLNNRKIRGCIQQGSGWLIVLGALEYNSLPEYKTEIVSRFGMDKIEIDVDTIQEPEDWKVGAYEPTTGLHGDIEYCYTIDLKEKTLKVEKVDRIGKNYEQSKQVFTDITAQAQLEFSKIATA